MGCRAGLTPRWVAGLRHGQAAGSRELPGVLGLHLGEKRPQHLPDRVRHLPQQSPPAAPQKSRTKPLQETPAPAQPLRAHLLRLQEGEGKKLLRHVRGGGDTGMPSPAPPRRAPSAWDRLGAKWGCGAPPEEDGVLAALPSHRFPHQCVLGPRGWGAAPPELPCVCVYRVLGGGTPGEGPCSVAAPEPPAQRDSSTDSSFFSLNAQLVSGSAPFLICCLAPRCLGVAPPPPSSPSVGSGAPGRGRLFYRLSLGVTLFNVQCY